MTDVALKAIAEATTESSPVIVEDRLVVLEKLDLAVKVVPVRQPDAESPMYIGVFVVTPMDQSCSIEVTCVGLGSHAEHEATVNWLATVYPVLVHWRGEHTCLVSTEQVAGFESIMGPVLARGTREGGADPSTHDFLAILKEPLSRARLSQSLHWLECYAVRMSDGSTNATCRLDNRDWSAGRKALLAHCKTWDGAITDYLYSRRQFLMLVPTGAPEQPRGSFWSRLFGR